MIQDKDRESKCRNLQKVLEWTTINPDFLSLPGDDELFGCAPIAVNSDTLLTKPDPILILFSIVSDN